MQRFRFLYPVMLAALLPWGCGEAPQDQDPLDDSEIESGAVFTEAEDVVFEDIIPGVVAFGTVAGDRETGAHGTFVRIPPGQATPLHTHGAAYEAVVIQGNFENPISGAEQSEIVLGAGSYYSVPADAEHVTRCAADSPTDCVSFFYQDVAFDFTPLEVGQNDPPEQPTAVFAVAGEVVFEDIIPGVVAFGTVSGDRETGAHGTFVRIPPGEATPLHVHSAAYQAVVVQGRFENPIPGDSVSDVVLSAGSYYDVPEETEHITRCAADSPVDCVSYFYQPVAFDFTPVE